jgi:hypothetical protein
MFKIPNNVYMVTRFEMRTFLAYVLFGVLGMRNMPTETLETEVDIMLAAVNEKGQLTKKEFVRIKRIGSKIPMTREQKETIYLSYDKLMEKHVNDYMVSEYGYC